MQENGLIFQPFGNLEVQKIFTFLSYFLLILKKNKIYLIAIVQKNEITLITHYYQNCYVKEIVDREDEIVERIRNKFNEINKFIPIDTYTIDFCVDPNSDKIWLIEINDPVS